LAKYFLLLIKIYATAIGAAVKPTQLSFTHCSTIEICLEATIINLLEVDNLLSGLFVYFGGWILLLYENFSTATWLSL
jgi:hypothetical protein